ncbi:putative secreted protein (Por secretion system target) [Gillisia mitskevichiae]|uniref:Putative secreted protein (Por secretion system target) n=1 Tax=Gillisia mitskevichiae TaxID=270921 RepID=A0A495P204_9FLAO|nr:T9SS type A sorting domain-containing protein [Gillisia mitskevichiae]RKS42699.1 putative secreted protein (Por secretion system target) [Gillisia mitskevichiae]
MRQIYILVLFIIPFIAHCQLSIKPNQELNTYLYSEGALVYVEQGIHLTPNSGNNPKPSIFLRKEAQLIQGTSNFQNTGDGVLSLYQEGNASNYTYNYWSMPVSNTFSNNTFGNQFFDPITKTESNPALISIGYNGTSKPLTISTKWIYKFSGTDYSDWEFIGNTFKLKPGEGFTMKGVDGTNTDINIYSVPNNAGNKQRYDLRGRPNSGIYELEIKEGDTKLVGNPYPSALDLNVFLQDNTNTTGIAYFWDSENIDSHYLKEYEGGYGAYSPGAGIFGYVPAIFNKFDGYGNTISEGGTTGAYYARRFSPIGQGFIVIGSHDGKIVFNNNYRHFVKEDQILSEFKSKKLELNYLKAEEFPLLRLNIELQSTYIRQILLVLRDNATEAVDHAMDAINPEYLSSDAGWMIDNENYLINVRPFNELEEIPFFIVLAEDSEIIFSIAEVKGFKPKVFLLDTNTSIYHNLSDGPIKFNLAAGDYSNRFKLTYTNKEQIYINWDIVKDITNFNIFQNNPESRLEIRIPAKSIHRDIILFDSLGKRIMEKKGITYESYHEFSTRKLSKGLYILKITNKDATIISKKVIISN